MKESVNSSYSDGISIIVPTECRVSLVGELVKSLKAARSTFALPSEVLIIDSSPENERKAIAEACLQLNAKLIDGPRNVREKRNLGIERARYSILLFLDSDCRATPEILTEHWACYHNGSENVPGGVLGQTVFEGPKTWVWRMVKNSSLITQFTVAADEHAATWGPASNISFRHEVIDQVGSFDTSFPFRLGGDDLDLSYRVVRAGFTLQCNPASIVYHNRRTWNSLRAVLSRAFRWGRMDYYLFVKHPEARIWSPPGFWGWALLVWVLLQIQALALNGVTPLSLFGIWVFLSLLLFFILSVKNRGSATRTKTGLFVDSLFTAVPEMTFFFGITLEFLRHGDFRFLWSYACFSPSTPRENWESDARNVWSNLIALLVCQAFIFSRV